MGRALVEMKENMANPKMVLEKGKVYVLDDKLADSLLKANPPACSVVKRDALADGTKILKQPKQADPVDPNGGDPAPRVKAKEDAASDEQVEEVVINDDTKKKAK